MLVFGLYLYSRFQCFQPPGAAEAQFLDLYDEFCGRMMEYKVHTDKRGLERFQHHPAAYLESLKEMSKRGTVVSGGEF